MPKYEKLSQGTTDAIRLAKETGVYRDISFHDDMVIRRRNLSKDTATVWRPTFVHDVDKILHCPFYNRYADKTQVFSLCKNDDITRRSLHVQLVSRIARTIGAALHLNLDLIEAIALGHDIGHPPFAHNGEMYLDELYLKHAGKHFYHNVQSVRVLDGIFPYNISLQTLGGILTHNGELLCEEYHVEHISGFEEFDKIIEKCYESKEFTAKLMPNTLEGIVVRISDVIAYLGKDRQDASRAKIVEESVFYNEEIGSINAEIINNLVVNIIENSYGKDYIKLDARHFKALKESQKDNYELIYYNAARAAKLSTTVRPMMEEIYGQLLDDLKANNRTSPIFRHHIDYINSIHYKRETSYESSDPNQIVVDYIASMTDDYLIDLHAYMFPNSDLCVEYKGYFDN
jgi:dGTPase